MWRRVSNFNPQNSRKLFFCSCRIISEKTLILNLQNKKSPAAQWKQHNHAERRKISDVFTTTVSSDLVSVPELTIRSTLSIQGLSEILKSDDKSLVLPSWDVGKLLYDSNSCLWRIFNIKVPEWLFPDGRTCVVFHKIDIGGHVCLYIRMEMFWNSCTTRKLQITNVLSKGSTCISEEQHINDIFYFAFQSLFNWSKSSWTLTLDFTSFKKTRVKCSCSCMRANNMK